MTPPQVQDPNVEPAGYTPPTSAGGILDRYARGERYFVGTRLSNESLDGAILVDVNLQRSTLRQVGFVGANLSGADFRHCTFSTVDYGRADLRRTRFDFCTFEDADFGGSLMADTSFVGAKGTAQSSMPFLTDLETMRRSGWQRRSVSRTEVVGFQWKDHAGVVAATLEGGLDAESWVTVSDEFHGTGLQILFHTLLLPLDRFLIDGVIFGLLGTETDCHIVELQERGSTTLVRLDSTNVEHLVIVAEALHERIWEAQERAQHVALLRLASVLQLSTMAAALTALVGKIDRMELRGDSDAVKAAVLEVLGDDAIEMLHDQGEKHVLAKWDNKLSTPTQKISRALGKMLVKKVAGEVGGVIEGEVKDAVKKLGDGEGSMD